MLTKRERYAAILSEISTMICNESDIIAKMANISAALRKEFCWLWVGFYRVVGDKLVLGPFQGDIACMRIARGRGVCGTAWNEKRIILVDDVEKFPGHIACSAESRSEIVVPVFKDEEVVAILDIDSGNPAEFDKTDKEFLQQIANILI